jgi:hypothetical protein
VSGSHLISRCTQSRFPVSASAEGVGWPVWLLPQRPHTAKAASAHCPITRQCLRWAVFQEVEDEIWGARTPRERRRVGMAFVIAPPGTGGSWVTADAF